MFLISWRRPTFIFALFIVLSCSTPVYFAYAQLDEGLVIDQGIASGEVTDHSAIVWSRANKEAQMNVEYDSNSNFLDAKSARAIATQATDLTAKVKLESLEADTVYNYRVWFSTLNGGKGNDRSDISNVVTGSFRTAPDPTTDKEIDFVISGDLGGQGLCRRVDLGYSIFSLMKNLSPDFFVFNGDQIYADSYCPREAPGDVVAWRNIVGDFPSVDWKSVNWTDLSQLHNIYLKHWEYNRGDTHLKDLLKYIPYYSQFDDHEVIDNYGSNWSSLPNENEDRAGYSNLVRIGINIFSNFSPIEDHNRFYRLFNWGEGLDLFILDTRSYRSNNILVDTLENNKTLLGENQLKWLEQGLYDSKTTWKIISSPNSLTVPNCSKYGCDSWATNGTDDRTFVRERSDLLKFLDYHNIENVIFIVTDAHFPANIRVDQDFDEDGDNLIFYELISGPLNAAPLDAKQLDPTINATFLYKESKIFNFGHLSVNNQEGIEKGQLIYRIIDNNGIVRPNSLLKLSPQ